MVVRLPQEAREFREAEIALAEARFQNKHPALDIRVADRIDPLLRCNLGDRSPEKGVCPSERGSIQVWAERRRS
jgi:hypothetical protein